jgi:hypothetical protein
MRRDGFSSQILNAVSSINSEWSGRGYDINSYFSHDLRYGPHCCITANHAPLTMCVAAVVEVIVTALNTWYAETNERTPFDRLPLRSWRGGSKRDIRAHIFMYEGFGSNGTAHALERFGIGRQCQFSELQPGDFINFNRTSGTGHACVFLGFIDATGNDVGAFGPSVVGFRYFSAQGKGLPDAGFGYRWAFFDGHCPSSMPAGKRRDCGVLRSDSPKLLCCGYLYHPSNWPDSPTVETRLRDFARPSMRPEATIPEVEGELSREMPHPDLSRFDGVTTD